MTDQDQKRKFFRLLYPHDERPQIEIAGEMFEVCDISAEGIKFEHASVKQFELGQLISGLITFADGGREFNVGKVLRVEQKTLAMTVVLLTQALPMTRIFDEQRRLIVKYKHNDQAPPDN